MMVSCTDRQTGTSPQIFPLPALALNPAPELGVLVQEAVEAQRVAEEAAQRSRERARTQPAARPVYGLD